MSNINTNDLCHFEILTNDIDGTRGFYEKNFGWAFEQHGEEYGNYVMGTLPNGTTCGIRAPQESEQPGFLPYVLVEDINAATKAAGNTGGHVVMSAMEIPNMGWMSVVLVHGVPLGLWQATDN